jgi:hypothetical protein
MKFLTEPGRLASHVLVDVLSVWSDATEAEERRIAASNLALDRLRETGAVAVHRVNEHQLELDATQLVSGALVSMDWLLRSFAEVTCQHEDLVLAQLREYLDRLAERTPLAGA